jgi:hypothetical protein
MGDHRRRLGQLRSVSHPLKASLLKRRSVHITEYDNGYRGFDKTRPLMHKTPEWQHFTSKVMPLIESRSSFIGQEFAFWATSPPQVLGGIYEMRTYNLVCLPSGIGLD